MRDLDRLLFCANYSGPAQFFVHFGKRPFWGYFNVEMHLKNLLQQGRCSFTLGDDPRFGSKALGTSRIPIDMTPIQKLENKNILGLINNLFAP